jgi:hypothetical protein
MVETGFIWLIIGTSYSEHGNKHPFSIKAEQIWLHENLLTFREEIFY